MKKSNTLLTLGALSMVALSFTACGTKTEKTTVIEKPAAVRVIVDEPKPNVSISIHGDGKKGHYEVHGEK